MSLSADMFFFIFRVLEDHRFRLEHLNKIAEGFSSRSLEDHRQLLSQSSTVDLGQSISKSKQSLRVMEANRDHKRRSK